MKLYTRTGDDGSTLLWGGRRVPKTHPRCEAYGTLDELATLLGQARAGLVQSPPPSEEGGLSPERIDKILRDLLTLGATIAGATKAMEGHRLTLEQSDIATLEGWIDESEGVLPPLRSFILATGAPTSALLHQARTVCRRAERRVLAIDPETEPIVGRDIGLVYLNRLSDLCFTWARLENRRRGVAEVLW